MNGADRVCEVLGELGVRHVFGLPGTQNVGLFEALRKSGLRSIVATDEAAAAFMATGYARASGGPAVLTTIPGPGFVYALAGVVEARHDSAPLVWMTLRPADEGRAFQLQRIDQEAMARPVVKHCMLVEAGEEIAPALRAAYQQAATGEPGPVLLEIASDVLEGAAGDLRPAVPSGSAPAVDVRELVALLERCERPVIQAGQGAQGASTAVRKLAHCLHAPVLVTSSGRGVVPDTDELAFIRDFSVGMGEVVPRLLERADLVVALGCKFTHNGSSAGRLRLPTEKLVRVDSSAEVLAANYPARLALHARVEDVVAALESAPLARRGWEDGELRALRGRLERENAEPLVDEPVLGDLGGAPVRAFFAALGAALDGKAVYVTDAGLHQALTRRYAIVTRPRGLLCPNDFQSMGFGLPGAIGAALARPADTVVACVGDGGLALSVGELLTAVREGIDLVVVVFNDGALNLIRRQQVSSYGHASGVMLRNPDFAALSAAVGCSYFPASGDLGELCARVAAAPGVRLVELRLSDTPSFRLRQVRSIVRERVRPAVPDGLWQALKRLVRR